MKRLSVLLAGSALAVSANAVNWSKVSESPTGTIFSVDLNSIESSDISVIDKKPMDNITVSIRRTYPTQKNSVQKNDGKDGAATKETKATKDKASQDITLHHSDQQLLISCKDASYYKRAYVDYGADDKVIKSWQSEKPILTTKDFVVTTPKTIGRLIVDQACKSYQDGQKSV
ncbi:hypothetical protein [Psychrobacter alimentarius]|uniref:hypothetical protein n=1 Tax=Psychrobacter alimentarius TaxID=261164 RepID=UPI0019180924|nr:hypothetical protein [Psychrobacter alimentarius]